jgi:hypothetical protein
MLDVKDIYWAAGLIEGEGCFQAENNKYPRLRVAMTDRDVVTKLHCLMGGKLSILNGYSRKDQYVLNVYGSLAIQWMLTLYYLMGERRKAKIREVVEIWKISSYPGKGTGSWSAERRKNHSQVVKLAHMRSRLKSHV